MSKRYTVSDGKLVLNLEEAEEGGYVVTSPLNPELITQAETHRRSVCERAATRPRPSAFARAGET